MDYLTFLQKLSEAKKNIDSHPVEGLKIICELMDNFNIVKIQYEHDDYIGNVIRGLEVQDLKNLIDHIVDKNYGQLWHMNILGLCYDHLKDYKTALEWYQRASLDNFATAQFNIGNLYCDECYVEKDCKKGFKWYMMAAKQNYKCANYALGILYFNGDGTVRNYREGIKYLRLAEDICSDENLYEIGEIYRVGKNIKKNSKEALRLYGLAANKGNKDAMVSIGDMNRLGDGIEKNFKNAIEWYHRALPNRRAKYGISCLYFKGEGVPENYQEARKWCILAASDNLPIAQTAMGNYYLEGLGVKRDELKALTWFQAAADKGCLQAESIINKLFAQSKSDWFGLTNSGSVSKEDFLVSRSDTKTRNKQNKRNKRKSRTATPISKKHKIKSSFSRLESFGLIDSSSVNKEDFSIPTLNTKMRNKQNKRKFGTVTSFSKKS